MVGTRRPEYICEVASALMLGPAYTSHRAPPTPVCPSAPRTTTRWTYHMRPACGRPGTTSVSVPVPVPATPHGVAIGRARSSFLRLSLVLPTLLLSVENATSISNSATSRPILQSHTEHALNFGHVFFDTG